MDQNQTTAFMAEAWEKERYFNGVTLMEALPSLAPMLEEGWLAGQRWAEQHPAEVRDLTAILAAVKQARARRFPGYVPSGEDRTVDVWESAWTDSAMTVAEASRESLEQSAPSDPFSRWCRQVRLITAETSYFAEEDMTHVVTLIFQGRRFHWRATVPWRRRLPTVMQILEDLLPKAEAANGVSFEVWVTGDVVHDLDDEWQYDQTCDLLQELQTWLGEEYSQILALVREKHEREREESNGWAYHVPAAYYEPLEYWWKVEKGWV
jgi:hypothetical protein